MRGEGGAAAARPGSSAEEKSKFYVMYWWVPYRAGACTDTRAMPIVTEAD